MKKFIVLLAVLLAITMIVAGCGRDADGVEDVYDNEASSPPESSTDSRSTSLGCTNLPNGQFTLVKGEEDTYRFYLGITSGSEVKVVANATATSICPPGEVCIVEEGSIQLCLYPSQLGDDGNMEPNYSAGSCTDFMEDPRIEEPLGQGSYYIGVKGEDDSYNYTYILHSGLEPGEDIDSAYPIETPFAGVFEIEEEPDHDYFSFNLNSASEISITVKTGSIGSDLDAMICLKDRDSIDECEDAPNSGDDEFISKVLNDGLYYVEVFAYNEESAGLYALHVSAKSSGASGAVSLGDPGDDAESALFISPPVYSNFAIEERDDETDVDYFSFYLNSASRVNISIDTESIGSDLSPKSSLLDSDENAVSSDEPLAPGLYYILVSGNDSTGPYILYYGLEPADYFPFAHSISLGVDSDFAIETEDDKDVFSFKLDKKSKVSIEIDSDLEAGVCLYNRRQREIECHYVAKGRNEFTTNDLLEEGSHYVEVYGRSGTGHYTLKLTKSNLK